MAKYRSKPQEPHEVEAFQWDGDAHTANTKIGDRYGIDWEYLSQGSSDLLLPAERYGETMTARIGDWVVHTPLGGFSVFTPEQFAASYEPVPGTEAENKLLSLCDDGELLDQLVKRFRARVQAGMKLDTTLQPLEQAAAALSARMTVVLDLADILLKQEARSEGGAM